MEKHHERNGYRRIDARDLRGDRATIGPLARRRAGRRPDRRNAAGGNANQRGDARLHPETARHRRGIAVYGRVDVRHARRLHPLPDRPHGRCRRIVIGLTGDLILDHAFGLVLVLSRIGATIALLPGLGETAIPPIVKAGMVLILPLLLLPIVEPQLPPRPTSQLALALMIAAELGDGLWFGWLARVLTISLPLAGQFIADFAGL